MEMYVIPQGFVINTILEKHVDESNNSVFQQLDTDSIKRMKLYILNQLSNGNFANMCGNCYPCD